MGNYSVILNESSPVVWAWGEEVPSGGGQAPWVWEKAPTLKGVGVISTVVDVGHVVCREHPPRVKGVGKVDLSTRRGHLIEPRPIIFATGGPAPYGVLNETPPTVSGVASFGAFASVWVGGEDTLVGEGFTDSRVGVLSPPPDSVVAVAAHGSVARGRCIEPHPQLLVQGAIWRTGRGILHESQPQIVGAGFSDKFLSSHIYEPPPSIRGVGAGEVFSTVNIVENRPTSYGRGTKTTVVQARISIPQAKVASIVYRTNQCIENPPVIKGEGRAGVKIPPVGFSITLLVGGYTTVEHAGGDALITSPVDFCYGYGTTGRFSSAIFAGVNETLSGRSVGSSVGCGKCIEMSGSIRGVGHGI